eukprot:CAMPEP_0174342696 /NCGR_PEP_ID=MMETSP0810-20121108/26361_1 /TAXON_ID=73025 ORGANISM="Eutreptiella gymnastica-like, Strain CCMP1594" /NCGR_SAMPLE_ID=MMETSP0810 /ASSEMBLY_ACC=CAM_ASM_000659 /LENGTH=73 /DNA_ID=CAMNT_0015464973 /DNA_START=515 /DNA_END=732 /DNA_ORIENTATION=-
MAWGREAQDGASRRFGYQAEAGGEPNPQVPRGGYTRGGDTFGPPEKDFGAFQSSYLLTAHFVIRGSSVTPPFG